MNTTNKQRTATCRPLYLHHLPITKLSPSPRCALFAVFHRHAEGFQLVADLIGEHPLFLLSHFAPHFDEKFNELVRVAGAFLFLQLQTKHAGQFTQSRLRRLELIVACAMEVRGSTKVTWGGKEIDLTPPWRRLRFDDAAKEYLGIENASSLPAQRVKEIQDEIEPSLINPTIVYDLPTSVSPLAKCRADNPLVTERFELIINSMEFANAYSELNDPVDQYNRFKSQLAERESGDEEAHMMDEDFIRSLEHGMPPNAGLGVGIDRVVMLLTDSSSIRDVILFPAMRPK